jgi:uncharacterized phage protein (TIGR02218 family)
MREIPDLLQAHLDGAVTTLCQAWRVVRRDGRVFGFTDHDVVLTFDDLAYQPMSGFLGSDVEQALGLQTQTSEVAGALSSAAITEADILAGRFDGARVETYLVNWAEISQRLLLNVQTIGEVTWAGSAFSAELRSLFHGLDQIQGRVYARRCDAALGDRRCGVDLDNPAFHAVVTIAEATGLRAVTVDGLDGFAPGWMRHGHLRRQCRPVGPDRRPRRRRYRAGASDVLDRHAAPAGTRRRLPRRCRMRQDIRGLPAEVQQ